MKLNVLSITIFKTMAIAAVLCLVACGDEDDDGAQPGIIIEDELTFDQRQAVNYFTDIALGFEFGTASRVTRKWTQDVVIFVDGEGSQELLDELDIIIADINELISESEIELRITTNQAESNYFLFLGSGDDYARIFPSLADLVQSNFGLFSVFFNGNNEITSANMYVDTFRASPLKQRHLLREELTQSLGLARDSSLFAESIFQSSFNLGCATSFAQIDEVLIQLLYDPRIATGLDEVRVLSFLEEFVVDYI